MYNKQQLEDNSFQHDRDNSHNSKQIDIDSIQTSLTLSHICSSFQLTLLKSIDSIAFKSGYKIESSESKTTTINLTIAKSRRELIKGITDGVLMEGYCYGVDIGAAGKISPRIKIRADEIAVVIEISRLSGDQHVKANALTLTDIAEDTLRKDPVAFYEQWGSHYLSRLVTGDTFHLIITIRSEQIENLEAIETNLNTIFNGVTLESGLVEAINDVKESYSVKIQIEQTGGPAPNISIDDLDGLLKWIDSDWVPAVDAMPSTLRSIFEGYWTLGAIGDELKALVYDDLIKTISLVDAIETYDEYSQQLEFIKYDHENSRFPRMPANFYGTTENEVSEIKEHIKEIARSRAAICRELESSLLDHQNYDQLYNQSEGIARRAENYAKYIKGLDLKARYPIIPGEDINFHIGNEYIGIDSENSFPITTVPENADKLRLMHNNQRLLNNNTVYVQSSSNNDKALTKSTDRALRYEKKGLVENQEWKITCNNLDSHDFIRPGQEIQVWNSQLEQYMALAGGYLNTDDRSIAWIIERS